MSIVVTFVLTRRKSAPRRLVGRIRHDRKPDLENLAKSLFDPRMLVGVWKPDEFRLELADVAIPLFVAAEAMGVDLVTLAVEKARADVKRGVR